jgi:hypothetical protein
MRIIGWKRRTFSSKNQEKFGKFGLVPALVIKNGLGGRIRVSI